LIVEINYSARVPCFFDSVADRQSFQVAVEWSVNASSHVAAFRTRQEKAKLAIKEEEILHAQMKKGSVGKQSVAAPIRQSQGAGAGHEEFISRLVGEFKEYRTQLQRAVDALPQHNAPSHGKCAAIPASFELNERRALPDDTSLPCLITSEHWKDFVERISIEQADHAEQLAAAARLAAQSRSLARSVCAPNLK
jgi:hypothetical protein